MIYVFGDFWFAQIDYMVFIYLFMSFLVYIFCKYGEDFVDYRSRAYWFGLGAASTSLFGLGAGGFLTMLIYHLCVWFFEKNGGLVKNERKG